MINPRKLINVNKTVNLIKSYSSFSRPGPPTLPPNEQKEFERLQKQAQEVNLNEVESDNNDLHPNAIKESLRSEFEGDVNPETGEIGGPKREPLRWKNEWSYGGRATDF